MKQLLVLGSMLAVGCSAPRSPQASDDQPIIGGTVDNGDPAIGMLNAQDGNTGWWCTGTLISPTVFLTAGHCVEDATASTQFSVFFGTDQSKAQSGDWSPVKEFHHHPQYNTNNIGAGYDCAVLILKNPSSTPPVPYSHTAVDNTFVNQPVRIVGYGNDDGQAGTGAGTKRQVSTLFDSFEDGIITVGEPTKTTCQGDSGGPTLYKFNGVETVIGVTSFGAAGCGTASEKTRVDKCAAWLDGYTGASCTPSCTGRSCGSDGCGGSCGACGAGQSCSSDGQCVAGCTPACSGKQCGDDGCGGSCGSCANGQTCGSSGQCTGGGGTCAHALCQSGNVLTASCDPCASQICNQDSYCCDTAWDDQCVSEVGSICGQSCS
jgi:V8-like Glu-specific endopeptidase